MPYSNHVINISSNWMKIGTAGVSLSFLARKWSKKGNITMVQTMMSNILFKKIIKINIEYIVWYDLFVLETTACSPSEIIFVGNAVSNEVCIKLSPHY